MSLHCFPKQIHLGGGINWRVVHGLGESQRGAGTRPDGVGATQLEPSQTTRLVGGTWLLVNSEIAHNWDIRNFVILLDFKKSRNMYTSLFMYLLIFGGMGREIKSEDLFSRIEWREYKLIKQIQSVLLFLNLYCG